MRPLSRELAVVTAVLAGCGGAVLHVPSDDAMRTLRPAEARAIVAAHQPVVAGCFNCTAVRYERMQVQGNAIQLMGAGGVAASVPLATAPLQLSSFAGTPGLDLGAGQWLWPDANAGRKLADALHVLKRHAQGYSDPVAEREFEMAARSFDPANRPPFPEEARKWRVQAEGAVRDKQFERAAELYAEALKVAPWWPEGRFNRALVLGETAQYREAAVEMRRYLTLLPNAENARAAQDKIYEWEGKTGR